MKRDKTSAKPSSSVRDNLKVAEMEDVAIDQAAAVAARRREQLSAAAEAAAAAAAARGRERKQLSDELEKRKREQVLQERRELFFFMDIDKSHASPGLSLRELRAVVKKHGDYKNEAALKTLFRAMDADGSGNISFEEADAYEDRAREDQMHTTSLSPLHSTSRHCAAAARQCLLKDISTSLALKEAAGASDTCAAAARQCLLLPKLTLASRNASAEKHRMESGKPSDEKNLIESQQGVVEAIGYAVGAAVTTGIGYGCYWMLTQGD